MNLGAEFKAALEKRISANPDGIGIQFKDRVLTNSEMSMALNSLRNEFGAVTKLNPT